MYIVIGILAGIIILQFIIMWKLPAAGERHLPPIGVYDET